MLEEWTSGKDYKSKSFVTVWNTVYECLTDHKSRIFADDLMYHKVWRAWNKTTVDPILQSTVRCILVDGTIHDNAVFEPNSRSPSGSSSAGFYVPVESKKSSAKMYSGIKPVAWIYADT